MKMREINWSINENLDRNELRKRVINKFMEEVPGKGNGEFTSKYIYYVEELNNGNKVYLARPVPLNKGFDFIINVENIKFTHISVKLRKKYQNNAPSHKNIFDDLKEKKKEDILKFKKLLILIERVFNCEEPEIILKEESEFSFKYGYSVELILKVLKWFFIEQDIRYWNWSGRKMLFDGLNAINN